MRRNHCRFRDSTAPVHLLLLDLQSVQNGYNHSFPPFFLGKLGERRAGSPARSASRQGQLGVIEIALDESVGSSSEGQLVVGHLSVQLLELSRGYRQR